MEWVFRYFGISLKQAKEPLPHRDDIMEFDVKTNTKELEKNIKLKGCSSDLQEKVKKAVTEYWDFFCEDGFRRPIRDFHSRLTQVAIHLSAVNCLGRVLMSLM